MVDNVVDNKMLEKNIQSAVIKYARDNGCVCYKMDATNHIGVPDYVVIPPSGKTLFIEFKQLGKKPTPMQYREHERLRTNHIEVHVIDNVNDGKFTIDRECLK